MHRSELRRPAFIAGASSGIGAATAQVLAAAGYPVALGARRAEICEQLAAKITADGGEAFAAQLDVADDNSVTTFVEAATSALGEPEVLVTSAGAVGLQRTHETGPGEFAAQVQLHLVGVQRLVAAVAPGMVTRQRGDLVFITSDVVIRPRPNMGGYVAAKHGLEGMAKAMLMELEGTGVRVGVVRPGPTLTGMGMDWDHETLTALFDEWAPWGLMRHAGYLKPADVANAVAAMVTTRPGAHLTLIEVQPEAPVQ
jgi:NADP-dependent 3-hydroxy acid dehydrogenase YdfG